MNFGSFERYVSLKNEFRRLAASALRRLTLFDLALVIIWLFLTPSAEYLMLAQATTQTTPATTEPKPSNDVKPPASASPITAAKTADTNPPTQVKAPAEPKLEVVNAETQTVWELVEGESETIKLQLTTHADGGVNLAQIAFVPIDKKKAPAEAAQVRVIGPAHGYPGMLKAGENMEISLIFPPHRSTGEYAASLTYTTAEASNEPLVFHTANVKIGMMHEWIAAVIASVFCLVIILLTFLVSKVGNKPLNFFQSPDGAYSVSKVQTWIWTLVIVFSYSYLFLWRDGNVELKANTWALLGISVASTGVAKVIAVKKEENKGGGVAILPPTSPAPNWLTSMLSDGRELSLMRIQMFAWTMVTATVYLVYLFQQQALWEVPAGLLVLMGISHSGYLVDKGAAPSSDMKVESVQPNSIKADATTKKNPQINIVVVGQNFDTEKVECLVGGKTLTLTKKEQDRLEGTLSAGLLDGGNKYDVVVQQPGENAEIMRDAFGVTA